MDDHGVFSSFFFFFLLKESRVVIEYLCIFATAWSRMSYGRMGIHEDDNIIKLPILTRNAAWYK